MEILIVCSDQAESGGGNIEGDPHPNRERAQRDKDGATRCR